MNNGDGPVTTRVALKNTIHAGITHPRVQALVQPGQLGAPPAVAGFGGVVLAWTDTGSYGLTFFDTPAQANAAKAAVRAWWRSKLGPDDGGAIAVDEGTVCTNWVDPNARMVWTPGPQPPLPVQPVRPVQPATGHGKR